MTKDQVRQIKLICYANWLITEKVGGDKGVRDLQMLKATVTLPGGLSLTCFLGEKLPNRKDLFLQLGWFIFYMLDGEPFNARNRTTTLLLLLWVLRYYRLGFDAPEFAEYIRTLDTLKHGNSDISLWLANHCR